MKRLIIGLVVLIGVAAGGYAAFQRYKIYLPGIIARWTDPIADNHPVQWAKGPAKGPATASSATRPPNIVIIVADDLGHNDISFFGGGIAGGLVKTPNIDSIGAQGASYDIAYAANATCSPSRAAMMTGRYPTRYGFEFTAVPVAFARAVAGGAHGGPLPVIFHEEYTRDLIDYPQMGVPHDQITIADLLKGGGYHTMQIGKWHLGEAKPLQPTGQGFDEALGFLAGGGMFMPPDSPGVVNAKLPWDPIDRFLWPNLPYAVQWNGGPRFAPKGHLTDYFTDNAIAAIKANRNRPFMLYLAYNAPHTPLQATRADYDALPQIKDHTQRVYGAMVRQLDRGIGRVLQTLKDVGIDDNTLVIFTSDNGGAWYTGIPDSNAPYRGYKATFFEGGLRVPFFLRWPGKIAAGTRLPGPAHHLDIFATVAAAAGLPIPADRVMDTVSLLTGAEARTPAAPHDLLFWRSGETKAVRQGNWKLQVAKRPNKAWLYNLAADPTEHHNLALADPARVAAMRALLAAHDKGMPKPLWPALIDAPVRIDVPLNAPWKTGQEYVYWSN